MEPEVLSSSLRGGTILVSLPSRVTPLSSGSPRVVVAGGGVVGLCVGLALLERGATVDLYDPQTHPSASAVAAGMLSPAFEAVLDPQGGDFQRLSAAVGAWPELLKRLGVPGALSRSGAMFVGRAGDAARVEEIHQALLGVGAAPERLTGAQARGLQPGLAPEIMTAVLAPGEARIAPEPLLAVLREAYGRAGGGILAGPALAQGEADGLVVAAGSGSSAFADAAPELALLQPIKGQILTFAGAAPERGPMVRGEGVYLCPQAGGAVAGATMEPGLSDLDLDPALLRGLHIKAASLFPALRLIKPVGRAGVRAGTPDGLPMAGASARPGVFLATGLRRNGWLLAPLVAQIVARAVFSEPQDQEAADFDPRRFS